MDPDRQLPMAAAPPERRDAAENRQRILAAARRLLERDGAAGVSMEAVAAAAGVGKGTVFRRFGDRAGLTEALLDESMRTFQDAFLTGPPPLGPGAPARERIEAFVLALVRTQDDNLELALAADHARRADARAVFGLLRVHLAVLIAEAGLDGDPHTLATVVLGAVSPGVMAQLRRESGATVEDRSRAVLTLLRGVTAP